MFAFFLFTIAGFGFAAASRRFQIFPGAFSALAAALLSAASADAAFSAFSAAAFAFPIAGFARFFSNVGLVAGCLWIVIGLSFLLTAGTNWHATILTEAAMQGIALARPSDMGELLEVKGIGPKKAEQYGEAILQIVRESKRVTLNGQEFELA